jgi:hypothetical protein
MIRKPRKLSIALSIVLLLGASTAVGADSVVREEPLVPLTPRFLAQGGGNMVGAHGGFEALFTNPVGYAAEPGELTVLSTSLWTHGAPSLAPDMLSRLFGASLRSDSAARDAFREGADGGFGVGGSVGLGYVGNNLGLGLISAADTFAVGDSWPDGLESTMTAEVSLIGGLALPLEFGPLQVTLAADVRPLVRIHAEGDRNATASLVSRYLGLDTGVPESTYRNTLSVFHGYGFAIDGGVRFAIEDISLVLGARDLGDTVLRYSVDDAGDVLDSLKQGGLPAPAEPGEERYVEVGAYVLPMRVHVGLDYRWRLTDWLGGRAYAELSGLTDAEAFGGSALGKSLLRHSRAGVAAAFGKPAELYAGLSSDHVTGGARLRMGPVGLSAGYRSPSLGLVDDRREPSSIALELALRF